MVLQWCFSRSRKYRPETKKSKSVRGDRLGFQHTLVDLILSAQATGASILNLAETKSDKSLARPYQLSFYREKLSSVSTESNLASCRDESILYPSDSTSFRFASNHNSAHCVLEKNRPRVDYATVNFSYLMRVETTRNELIKLASLLGTQVLLCLCMPKPGQMENNDRTLKELATPDVVYQLWCIQYPQLEPAQTYELKFGLIHLLPKFHSLAGEDPHKHLKEFHVVCSTMRP
ncbi:hypothetical protein CR513_46766, partial [Mucuna pruriens]